MLKEIKNKILKDYSTDIAFRYLPVIDIIKKNDLMSSKILEVGSGDLGITTYFKKEITGLDIKFSNQTDQFLKKVEYDGNFFPFKNNEFDTVISVDSFEHIPPEKRQNFINEIMRVAKFFFILVVPCGRLSYAHDLKLADYFLKINHYQDNNFFYEHINNGLPEVKEIIKFIEAAAKNFNKNIIMDGPKKLLNLQLREIIIKCKINKSPMLKIIYYLFLFLLPLRNFLNFGNCYRRLFYIRIKP